MHRDFLNATTPVSEQAAGWLFEMAEAPPDDGIRRDFVKWLKKSPQHIEEFLEIAVLEQELRRLPLDIERIMAEVRAVVRPGAVPIRDDAGLTKRKVTKGLRPNWQRYGWASAAGVAVVAIVFALMLVDEPQSLVHQTDFGEQRSIQLSDGSIVTLNTRSAVEVQYGDGERRVTLLSGEAMFDVATNVSKPFVVDTGDVFLRVLGTRFSVYRRSHSVHVAVVEGSVSAVTQYLPHEQVVVRAGEGAVATAKGVTLRDGLFDVRRAIAWTEGRLIFDGARLSEVVAEFNRYNRVPLIVEDDSLAERTITTVFNAHDVRALVGFLELQPDVKVEYGAEAIRIRVKR
jgi:transmembrane sensor